MQELKICFPDAIMARCANHVSRALFNKCKNLNKVKCKCARKGKKFVGSHMSLLLCKRIHVRAGQVRACACVCVCCVFFPHAFFFLLRR